MTELPGIASHRSSRLPGTKDGLDFLPTPPWGTRALCEKLGASLKDCSVWEPACGKLDMVRPLLEYMTPGEPLIYSDIVARLPDIWEHDFTSLAPPVWVRGVRIDWVITNPPFIKGPEFILTAMMHADNVAMLVRTNFLEGQDRYNHIYSQVPPTRTIQFVERLPMFVGRLDPDGSTMTAYMWLVWEKGCERRPMEWIEPCRSRLERPGDYDQYLEPLPLIGT